ncbi:MAG: metal-dependent hydrolase [Actinobacteria bacterium]|nr:metal-dependent hydrolase [Actinomycetota bacterium]MCL5887827.1 metal-dependent hydrolase [Actinomycetota bacterium]
MNGGAHLTIGTGSTVVGLFALKALGVSLDPLTILLGAMAGGLGALAPDLDHPDSKASNSLPDKLFGLAISLAIPLVFIGGLFALFGQRLGGVDLITPLMPILEAVGILMGFAIALVIASKLIRRHTSHRGATHSYFAAGIATMFAVLVCLVFSWPAWFGLLFGWGWLTHLWADSATKVGLPYLWWLPFGNSGNVTPVAVRASIPVREVPRRQPLSVAPLAVESVTPVCPKCDVPMILRTAKQGAQKGNQFYGCKNFPSCRQTKPA